MHRKLSVLGAIALSACTQSAINTDPLKLSYINAFPDKTISCDAADPYVLCRFTTGGNEGLWIYEDGQFQAVNGRAIEVAEKTGYPVYGDRAFVDIETVIQQF